MTHDLKIFPKFFDAIANKEKTFEVRKNDRGYKVGDKLLLFECEQEAGGSYTGREMTATITYILAEEDFPIALKPGYCVIGIKVKDD
ncbi:MAG: DUF3850 domain-containing protein [Peptococcaceae bacterium]|nr:DUF3850 domain-containing protein [Peptococcaceae bacterium]